MWPLPNRRPVEQRFVYTGSDLIDKEFLRQHYGWMLWSNPKASDEVLLRNILYQGGMFDILNLAKVYGVERVRAEWESMKQEEDVRSDVAQCARLDRIVRNLEKAAYAS